MSNSSPTNSSKANTSRRSSVVPPLDEDVIKGASGNFALVSQDPPFTVSHSLPSPSAAVADTPMAIAAFLQHQQQQQQQQQSVQLEQDYLNTRGTLQHCNRYVLLSVLTTLLDEYPLQLTIPIRNRLEHILMQRPPTTNVAVSPNSSSARNGHSTRKGQSNVATYANGGNNGSAIHNATLANGVHLSGGATGTWGTGGLATNQSVGSNPATPYSGQPSPNHRKPRHKNKDEEQELCYIHQSMRALKHLQKNPQTGNYECIHGFHCLVDGPVEVPSSATGTNANSNNTSAMNHNDSNNNRDNDTNPFMFDVNATRASNFDHYDGDEELKDLQDLLQSVRDMQED